MRTKIAIQARIYEAIPRPFRRLVNNLRLIPSYLHWRRSGTGRTHAERVLGPMHNAYQGFRCVVIGNGPSLKKMDLTVLRDEYTFGLNRIYLLFDELGFNTDFLVAVNRFVMNQFALELAATDSFKILNWLHREKFSPDQETMFLSTKPFVRMDGAILDGYFSGGGTVTNVALELAYFLGFSEVILIGVDHSYQAGEGLPGTPVVARDQDDDHFHPEYFGPGVTWQLPNYKAMETGYRQALDLFTGDGRRIVDATVGGKLEIFLKADFDNCLKDRRYCNKLSVEKN